MIIAPERGLAPGQDGEGVDKFRVEDTGGPGEFELLVLLHLMQGNCDMVDRAFLEIRFRVPFRDEAVAYGLKLHVSRRAEQGCARTEPMFEGIPADGGLAFRGARTGRALRIAAVGLDLSFRCHDLVLLAAD